jgi:predicted amidophosphoribosyltransferase
MIATMEKQHKQEKDIKILVTFIGAYCRGKHKSAKGVLCPECAELLRYARTRREKCPLDPKPACKHCPTHCYAKAPLAKIREVMEYSGKRLLLRGRLDLLWHYFF